MARKYGKVEATFWQNAKVRRLPDAAKMLLIYLFSCPHGNSIGCFVLPSGYIESDLGWSREQVSEQLSILVSIRLIERCDTTFLTRICGWWGHNSIDNGKMVYAVNDAIRSLPHNTPVFASFIKDLRDYAASVGKAYLTGLHTGIETSVEPVLIPAPIIEPEPETQNPPYPPLQPVSAKAKPTGKRKPKSEPPEFAAFYQRYPKHEARQDACRAWCKAVETTPVEVIEAGLTRALAAWSAKGTEYGYIPLPASWLNGKRWTDEYRANGRGDDHGRVIPIQSNNPDMLKASLEGRDLYGELEAESRRRRGLAG